MKITIFTGNQPRHISLVEKLTKISDQVFAIIEANTVFPGRIEDFYKKSDVMQEYFSHVIHAEKTVFGGSRFAPPNVKYLILKDGDLNLLDTAIFEEVLKSEIIVVFGSSYIKDTLCDLLIKKNAINIHMGVSPFYRGSSCNFWALYDKRPEMVGGTIHLLTKGLDSGSMLFHVFPKPKPVEPFVYGMQAVEATQKALVEKIENEELFKIKSRVQDKNLEIRYTRNIDFTDDVAKKYLKSLPSPEEIFEAVKNRKEELFVNPVYR